MYAGTSSGLASSLSTMGENGLIFSPFPVEQLKINRSSMQELLTTGSEIG